MTSVIEQVRTQDSQERQQEIVDVLVDAFSDLITASPAAFRRKVRKMAADPFAFYRGAACPFYHDMARLSRHGPRRRPLGDTRRRPSLDPG